eukprot:8774906-Pyramimonas_sp.AAC.2
MQQSMHSKGNDVGAPRAKTQTRGETKGAPGQRVGGELANSAIVSRGMVEAALVASAGAKAKVHTHGHTVLSVHLDVRRGMCKGAHWPCAFVALEVAAHLRRRGRVSSQVGNRGRLIKLGYRREWRRALRP